MSAWEKEEMHYWEGRYSFQGRIFLPTYRVFERWKFLFQGIGNDIRRRTLLEIGCYFPHTVLHTPNPSEYEYAYVGVDVARKTLIAAKSYLPDAVFVRCSVTKLPFKEESFDIILSLGACMHEGGTIRAYRSRQT